MSHSKDKLKELIGNLIEAGEELRYYEYGADTYPLGHIVRKWDAVKEELEQALATLEPGGKGDSMDIKDLADLPGQPQDRPAEEILVPWPRWRTLFHTLWSNNVHHPGYNKRMWSELEEEVFKLERKPMNKIERDRDELLKQLKALVVQIAASVNLIVPPGVLRAIDEAEKSADISAKDVFISAEVRRTSDDVPAQKLHYRLET